MNFTEKIEEILQKEAQAIEHAGGDAVYDHRPRDGEHLHADAQDEALAFKFQRRRGYRVGKAGDGHQRARAAEARQLVVQVEAGEQHAQKYQRDRSGAAGQFRVQAGHGIELDEELAERADRAADQEREQHVLAQWRVGRGFLVHAFIFFWRKCHTVYHTFTFCCLNLR